MKDIKQTKSICPECLKPLDATIYEDQGKVFIKKTCPEHGACTELYWSDYDQYVRAEKFRCEGTGVENPRTQKEQGLPKRLRHMPRTPLSHSISNHRHHQPL